MKFKRLLKIWIWVAIVTGILIGFGTIQFLKIMGANIFLPSSIFEIYGASIFVSVGFTMYKVLIWEAKKEEQFEANNQVGNK